MAVDPRDGAFGGLRQLRIPARAQHFIAVFFIYRRFTFDLASGYDGIHITPPLGS
jgi:hypothetical protein